MKKLLLWSMFLLVYTGAIAQNPIRFQFYDIEPDVLIQVETLKNFSGTDLNEMLLGRIPGLNVVSYDKDESPVLYVVDGLVWASIEGLSIHNIESIAYYRGGLNHQLGIQHTKPNGVIYIETKQPSYTQKLQTEVNALNALNVFNERGIEGKYRVMQGYNVALSQGSQRLSWRGSVGYNRAGRNRYQQDYSNQKQFNAGLRYQPARWIEFAVNINYAPLNGESAAEILPSVVPDQYPNRYYIKEREDWSGAISATLNFGGGWVNQTSVSKNNNQQEISTHRTTEWAAKIEEHAKSKHQNFALTNDLSYRFNLSNDAIRIRTGALLQLNKNDRDERMATRTQFVGKAMQSGSIHYRWDGQKYYSGAVQASADFYKIFSLQIGLRGDNSTRIIPKKISTSPFVYSAINIHQAFFKEIDWLNDLKIYAAYGEDGTKAPTTIWPAYSMSNGQSNNYPPGDNIVPGPILNRIENGYDKRMNTLNVGFKSSFFSERLHVMADWFRSEYLGQLSIPLPTASEYSSYNLLTPFKLSAWRASIDVDIAQQEAFQWSGGVNVFQNKNGIKNKSESLTAVLTDSESYLSNLNMNKPQIGMQHFIRAKQLSLALNGYAYFDHPYRQTTMVRYDKVISTVKSSLFALNYMALGYDFGSKKIASNAIDARPYRLSIVGRNMLLNKKGVFSDNLSKSIGVSLNARF